MAPNLLRDGKPNPPGMVGGSDQGKTGYDAVLPSLQMNPAPQVTADAFKAMREGRRLPAWKPSQDDTHTEA